MPTSIRKEYKQLHLRLFGAENLPKMDYQLIGTGTIDAYVKLKIGKRTLKTKVVTQKDDKVVWNQEMLLPIELPLKQERYELEVWDEDKTFDELACTFYIELEAALKYDRSFGEQVSCQKWINLFGSPPGYDNEKMNTNPALGTAWKGRILCEYWVEDVKYPKVHISSLSGVDGWIVASGRNVKYELAVEFGQGVCLPYKDKFRLKLQLGKHIIMSDKPKDSDTSWCRWDQQEKRVIEDSYQGLKRFPAYFLYLLDSSDRPVSYWRGSIMDHRELNSPITWKNFKRDKAVGQVKDDVHAGIISFRLLIRQVAAANPPLAEGHGHPWGVPIAKRYSTYKLRAAVYQCENLPPADSNGTSDPFVQLYTHGDEQVKTKFCYDTNNPIYYQVLEVPFHMDTLERAAPIILNVWDHDDELLDSSDDLIGRAVVFLDDPAMADIISREDVIREPKWLPVSRFWAHSCGSCEVEENSA